MLEYELSFCGVPFLTDRGRSARDILRPDGPESPHYKVLDHQRCDSDIIDELNRIIPSMYLQDFAISSNTTRNTDELAGKSPVGPFPNPQIRIGDWYYPTGASRFSVFRGLATSTQTKEMLRSSNGSPGVFIMKATTDAISQPSSSYTLTTSMYLLPPRPLAEHGGSFDGLYLITLVDERYYFQNNPVLLTVSDGTTWRDLLLSLISALGISTTIPTIPDVYGQPEPDSQLWARWESAALLLDAVCYNIGSTVVREFDGSYNIYTPVQSQRIVQTNRNSLSYVLREAGGDIFQSGSSQLKVGNLLAARNTVVPSTVYVSFPYYVTGSDPLPHFLNPRNATPRQTAWIEDSFGAAYTVAVPIASGGQFVSGLTGVSQNIIRCTAKALIDTESSTSPNNVSGLTALAMQLAKDAYDAQIAAALDEVYPGTFAWTPEGIHDIVWTYSEKSRQASTRVLRTQWTNFVTEMQHRTPPVSGYSSIPAGVGGPTVSQSWWDDSSWIGAPSTTLSAPLTSGTTTVSVVNSANFPTNERWKAAVNGEIMLCEGTIGGTTFSVVYRGIDGTLQGNHAAGDTFAQILPNTTYGVNLVTLGKGQYVFPKQCTSGGVTGVEIVPQTQTVIVNGDAGGGLWDASTELYNYRAGAFGANESVYAIDRNGFSLVPGRLYDGQFLGYKNNRPIYAVSEYPSTSGATGGNTGINMSLDDGTSRISGVGYLELHTPTWLLDSPSSGTAREKLNWYDNTPEPVQASGNPGTSEQPSRGDHVHALASGAINSGNFTVINWYFTFASGAIVNFASGITINFNDYVFNFGNSLYVPNYGQQYLSGNYNVLSGGGGAGWSDTGLGVTLPSGGVYILSCDTAGVIQTDAINAIDILSVKLYNSTASVDVPNSIRECVHTYHSGTWQDAATISTIYNVSGNAIDIKLYAKLTYTSPPSQTTMLGGSGGPTVLNYHQLMKGTGTQ